MKKNVLEEVTSEKLFLPKIPKQLEILAFEK